MTVATTHAENKFTGDGVQTVFTFTFQVIKNSPSLVVYKDGAIQSVGFTVSVNTDQETSPGGAVTFSVAPANGSEVIVRRANPQTQNTDFPLEAKLSTQSVEAAIDKVMLCVQEATADINKKTFVWRGTWSASRNYVIGDAVYYNGSSYLALAANINSAPPSANWATLALRGEGVVWKGAWSNATAYVVNDAVAYNGTSYIAVVNNTNSAPPSANWNVLASKGDAGTNGTNGIDGLPGLAWKGAWSNATNYVVNDGVSYSGSSYICIAAHINSAPPSANWNLIAAKGTDGSGTGDVVGPSTVTDGRVAVFDTTTGKLLKQGTRLETELVAGPAAAVTNGRVAVFDGTSGRLLKQDTRLASDLVAGPATSTANAVALFNGTGGKTIKDGVAPGASGNVLTSDGTNWTSAPPSGALSRVKSTAIAPSLGGLATFAHGKGKKPIGAWLSAVCLTAEGGYAVNDEIIVSDYTSRSNGLDNRNTIRIDSTNIYVRWCDTGPVFAGDKGTGARTTLTPANWNFYIYGLFD
ncbi:MAG: hypothetical protein K2Y32_00330 [Candidatus Obscuribacterales bacterium]|nr:hypothetical protein [Candidatus Obscuribacterales bacterium]